jgi:hypothetical protein
MMGSTYNSSTNHKNEYRKEGIENENEKQNQQTKKPPKGAKVGSCFFLFVCFVVVVAESAYIS